MYSLCTGHILLGATFKCSVTKKINSERTYSKERLSKYRYSVIIEDNGSKDSFFSRCSYSPIAKKDTCDRYKVDKIANDTNVNIKKYYIFQSQFNVQIFKNLSFVEDNGRADIAFGKCKLLTADP